jgi:CHAT domain-containing protein
LNRRASRDEPAAINLINLGNLASLVGDYPHTDAHYGEALALYRASANRVGEASVLHDLGLLELQRGDFHAALALLSQSLTIYSVTGPTTEELAVRRDLATTAAAMGNLQQAVTQLGRAERLASVRKESPQVLGQLALAQADLAMRFNRLPKAETFFRHAADLARQGNDIRGLAEAQRGLGLLELYLGNDRDAQVRLAESLQTAERAEDRRAAALTRLLLGYAQVQARDTTAARVTLTRARSDVVALGDSASEAISLGVLGQLQMLEGAPLAAESLYRAGLERLGSQVAPTIGWSLHAGLADALRIRGTPDQAVQEWRAAVREVERMSGTMPLEERRAAFLADKWDVYAQLAFAEIARGRADAGFEASESLRARELLDLLARGRIGKIGPSVQRDSLSARERDLRRQITNLMAALEEPSEDGAELRGPLAVNAASATVREALARAQGEYGELLTAAHEAEPGDASSVAGTVASLDDVKHALSPDEALLEYLVGDSNTVVFVVTADTAAAIDVGATRHDLAKMVDFSRGVLSRVSSTTAPNVWRASLHRLYRYLIEPVEKTGLLRGKRSLRIVAHAELHYVPFAALIGPSGSSAYLIQRYRLTYAPSASVWLRLHRTHTSSASSGVLALAPHPAALPGSAAEVGAIQRVFGSRAKVLVGAKATKRALRESAGEQAIIHFASYGVLNKDNPLFSFVDMMPSGDEDGRLEVHEVFGLPLRGQLVVLSACQTALGSGTLADVPPGDEWVGLVQAFLSAGASDVIATLWPVQDRTTADFMARFYSKLAAGEASATALAEAQRAALRNPETAHPFFWAGFTLSGD